MPNNEALLPLAILAAVGIAIVVSFVLFLGLLRPWLQAILSGAPISILDLVGMRLRRMDVNAVVRALIMARQTGVELTSRQVQRASLQGVDLDKITLAYIESQRRKMGTTFEELVELDLQDRLAELLRP